MGKFWFESSSIHFVFCVLTIIHSIIIQVLILLLFLIRDGMISVKSRVRNSEEKGGCVLETFG